MPKAASSSRENAPRIATIGAVSVPGATSAAQLIQLDLAGIAVSAGSACSSGSMKPSQVLAAMGVPADVAGGVVRVSFGRTRARRTSTASLPSGGESRSAQQVRGGMIYLDYQATTPLAPEVAEAMLPWLAEKFANPHSPSQLGARSRGGGRGRARAGRRAIGLAWRQRRLHQRRDRGAQLGDQGHGRDRADRRNRIITVATEHAAVLDTCEWLAGRASI